MTEAKNIPIKAKLNNLKVRGFLLVFQMILPFFLYIAITQNQQFLSLIIATLFTLSMAFLVWLG